MENDIIGNWLYWASDLIFDSYTMLCLKRFLHPDRYSNIVKYIDHNYASDDDLDHKFGGNYESDTGLGEIPLYVESTESFISKHIMTPGSDMSTIIISKLRNIENVISNNSFYYNNFSLRLIDNETIEFAPWNKFLYPWRADTNLSIGGCKSTIDVDISFEKNHLLPNYIRKCKIVVKGYVYDLFDIKFGDVFTRSGLIVQSNNGKNGLNHGMVFKHKIELMSVIYGVIYYGKLIIMAEDVIF